MATLFLKNFVKTSLLGAVGNEPDYHIMQTALGYYEKGVLTEDDLQEINDAIKNYTDKQNENYKSEVVENVPIENVPDENPNQEVEDTPDTPSDE